MIENRTQIVTVVISGIAVIISLLSAYWALFLPASLSVATPAEIQISNTLSGLPDTFINLGFKAHGSKQQSLYVNKIEVSIKKESSNEIVNLYPVYSDDFPFIIAGGEQKFTKALYLVNDTISEKVARSKRWCSLMEKRSANNLKSRAAEFCGDLVTYYLNREKKDTDSSENQESVNEEYDADIADGENMREVVVASSRVKKSDTAEEEMNNTFDLLSNFLDKSSIREEQHYNKSLALYEKYLGEEKSSDTHSRLVYEAKTIINSLSSESRKQIIFFESGKYNIIIKVYNNAEKMLFESNHYFHVDEVLAEVLRNSYNSSSRVRITKN